MANQQHLDILKQGVKTWNQWRQEQFDARSGSFKEVDLSGADLSGATLINANLRDTQLQGAKLINARLTFAYLVRANLSGADLTGANLHGCGLQGTNLSDANLRGANLLAANLLGTNLTGADLTGADLTHATLAGANLQKATLTGCRVYGVSVWDVDLTGAEQSNLIITRSHPDVPTVTVDNLEVAQFIHLLLNHKKLREVLNAVTGRGVLILGRFGGGGLEVLQAIATKLREQNYLPMIFDFERPQDRNYTETVKTLAGLARFIIADLSGPSVPQELYATVPHFKIPFVPIIEAGRKQFAMSVDLLEYPWVVRPPVTFATTEELLEQLPTKVITPAEEKYQARQKLLDELFNKT